MVVIKLNIVEYFGDWIYVFSIVVRGGIDEMEKNSSPLTTISYNRELLVCFNVDSSFS